MCIDDMLYIVGVGDVDVYVACIYIFMACCNDDEVVRVQKFIKKKIN